ncbi:MAG: lysophospholipid acyltransferase family protein [Chthoniobacterales bacterium]
MHARHDSHVSEVTHCPQKEGFLKFLLWLPVNILQAVSLGVLCGIVIPLAIAARKISGNTGPALWMARNVWARVILAGGFSSLRVAGLENLSRARPALIVSNHRSYADIPILYRALPIPLNFAGKKELERMPLIGMFGRAVGMIFLDRSTHQRAAKGILDLKASLERGEWMGVFPEGTRSVDGTLGRFASGSFASAIAAGVDVLPVAILGSDRMLRRGGFLVRPSKLEVLIGKPIPTTGLKPGDRFELASKTNSVVSGLMAGTGSDA